jgi:hypothetical protein
MLHAACENKRANQAVRCVSAARPDCATTGWDMRCERLDGRSFARSLSLLDSLVLRQRSGQSLTEYVHFMRQAFDNYNETCKMIDGSATIHHHQMGLLKLRGISSTIPFGQAKLSVINAFDTNYLMSTDEVMARIFHMAQNMKEELPGADGTARGGPTPPISTVVAAERGSHSGRGNTNRGARGGCGLPNKCSGCGSLDHIMSSCMASDDALLK